MKARPTDRHEERPIQARGDMKRLGEQSEKLFGAGTPETPGDDPNDPIEIWGRRIGRTLGYLIAAGLLAYLLVTYVFRAA